jgi:hypothetical protein
LVAGLRIGEAIRRMGFSTIVPDGRHCASACAFAWLGGIERFIGTDARIGLGTIMYYYTKPLSD